MKQERDVFFMTKRRILSAARLVLALALGLVFTIAGSSLSAFAAGCEGIRGSVLRLHILANSDSDADQALKLAVRDRILTLDNTLCDEAGNLADAERIAGRELAAIEAAAADEIVRRGYDYPVKAELVRMYFNTREYENFTLPAGSYDAVRVTIGDGAGHNWWCVLYPPLCLPAAESRTGLADLLTPEELEIVQGQPKYEYRFAVVEWLEKLKSWISN